MVFLLFFGTFICLVTLGHLLVFLSALKFITFLPEFSFLKILLVSLVIAVSFVGATVLSRYSTMMLVRAIYAILSFWHGLLWYLMLASALAWVVLALSMLAGYKPNLSYAAIVLFSAALLFAVYGLWNARNYKVVPYEVGIKGLPAFWENKKIVQLSDMHLGAINGLDSFARITNLVNAENPDLIVFTGDYFDGSCPKPELFAQAINGLKPPLGVLFIMGNHEIYEGVDKVKQALANIENLKILDNEEINLEGLYFYGAGYPAGRHSPHLNEALIPNYSDKPSVLLFHEPKDVDIAKKLGFDLILSGHTHRGQLWPFGLITKKIYGQYHAGFHTEDNFSIITSSGTGSWGPPIKTGSTAEIGLITLKTK